VPRQDLRPLALSLPAALLLLRLLRAALPFFFSRAFSASRSLPARASALRSFGSGSSASRSSASFFVFFLRGKASLFGRGALGSGFFGATFGGHFRL
jgi:hypothetical protein